MDSFQSIPLPFVHFQNGSIETGIDAVILSTGFQMEFPILEGLVSVCLEMLFVGSLGNLRKKRATEAPSDGKKSRSRVP